MRTELGSWRSAWLGDELARLARRKWRWKRLRRGGGRGGQLVEEEEEEAASGHAL